MAKKKRLTIEDLARIIQDDVVSQMATKDDLAQLEKRLTAHLDEHGRRLDHLESNTSAIRVTQNKLITTLSGKRMLTMEEARGLSGA